MYLTRYEERMLAGEYGYAAQKSMEILVAIGKIYEAERMVEIKSAQISGVSYKSLGEEGLEFIEDLARDGKVAVTTTLNPCGMDLEGWRSMGIPEEFAERQLRVIKAYMSLGVKPALTCTPYLAGNRPRPGDHIAWSESSAVIYANSVIGARTNREGGPSALAAAIAGRTPLYGLHLDDNRVPSIEVRVSAKLKGEYDYAALGFHVGKMIGDRVPIFIGLRGSSAEELKALGAALACSGGVALFHVKGVTPEAERFSINDVSERIEVGGGELREIFDELNDHNPNPDLIFIGCPHTSLKELIVFMELLGGRAVKRRTWIFTSREVKSAAEKIGLLRKLESAGIKVITDTCPIVMPIRSLKINSVATNSAKGAWFSRNLNRLKVSFLPMERLVELATR